MHLVRIIRQERFLHIETVEVQVEIIPVINTREVYFGNLSFGTVAVKRISAAEIPVGLCHHIPTKTPARIKIEIAFRCDHAAIVFFAVNGVYIEFARLVLVNASNTKIVCAIFQAMTPFGFGQEALLRVIGRRKGHVVVRRKCPEIRVLDAEAEIVLVGKTRKQEAALALHCRVCHLECREIGKWHTKELEAAMFKTNRLRRAVPDDLARLDLPENRLVRILRAGFAGRIDAIVERRDFAVAAFSAFGGKAGVVRRLDTKAVHEAVAETVGDIHMFGVDLVAVAFDDFNITRRGHTPRLLVIGYLVGDEMVAVILDTHFALSRDGIDVAIIDELVCLQKHARIRIALIIGCESVLCRCRRGQGCDRNER